MEVAMQKLDENFVSAAWFGFAFLDLGHSFGSR
jgi:hypothetical protein